MQDVALKDLLEAGCHFGHKVDRWHPKATSFIYQERDGIHVIDLAKTKSGLLKAAEFIRDTVANGGTVLFTGTKKQATAIVKEEAGRAGAPYISKRWIGGFLTNWEQVHKNLEKIRRLTEEQKNNAWKKYPKHERVKLARYLTKLNEFYGGVVTLTDKPQVIVVVDVKREAVAVREAKRTAVTIVGIVDTNSDPTDIDYVIPANDDAVGSIKFLINFLASAYLEGAEIKQKAAEKATKAIKDTAEKAVKADSTQSTVVNLKPVEDVKIEKAKTVAEATKVSKVKTVTDKPKKEKKAQKTMSEPGTQ